MLVKNYWERFWKFANTTAGAVILTAIIGGISFTALLYTAWIWVKTTFNYILNDIILAEYTLQGWQVFILTFGLVGVLYLVDMYYEYNRINEEDEVNEEDEETTVTELEGLVLKVFDANYGERFSVEDIARILNSTDMLSIERAVSNLAFGWIFLHIDNNIYRGLTYALNGNGGDYILENLRD